jgi:hypothetical protein
VTCVPLPNQIGLLRGIVSWGMAFDKFIETEASWKYDKHHIEDGFAEMRFFTAKSI